jgi:hypothetical protein
VGEPDDPLRADDALVGAEHEDVLLGAGAADEGESGAGYDESGHDDVDEHPTSIAALDDRPTTEIPPVVVPAPQPRGRFAGVASWVVFAAVAVVVIAATTTWASWLQGPTAERQSFTGLIQPPVPTATSSPPPPAETTAAAPPSAEPEPQPERKPEPAARPTQRPRVTRAPAPPPPPAAAVNAPVTPDGEKKEEKPPKTSAASGPAVADADTSEKETADAGKQKTEDDE